MTNVQEVPEVIEEQQEIPVAENSAGEIVDTVPEEDIDKDTDEENDGVESEEDEDEEEEN